jgi:hypothetical protein
MNNIKTPPNGLFWQWVRFVSQIVIIPVLIWGVKLTIDVEVMKGNRFTSQDAVAQTQTLFNALNAHAVQAGHPVMVERVGSLQETILQRLEAIDARLERIEAGVR